MHAKDTDNALDAAQKTADTATAAADLATEAANREISSTREVEAI